MLSKPLILALFVSISLNCLSGYLSYSFYSDKAVAEAQLDTAVDANKDLQLSLEKKETACKITDVIVSEYTKEKQEIVSETDAVLNAIDKMASVSVVEENSSKGGLFSKEKENVNKQSNVVSLDAELPEPLRLLLQDSCNRSKGSECTHP